MNEIIRQLPECSVPKILLTRYTLKFKEEKCLFNPIVFLSLSLTEPCISPDMCINKVVFPSMRKICLMNAPKEKTLIPLTINPSPSFPNVKLTLKKYKQSFFSTFWIILRVHTAFLCWKLPLCAFHMGTTEMIQSFVKVLAWRWETPPFQICNM